MKTSFLNKKTFLLKLSNVKETFLSWSKSADINCYQKMLDYSGNYFVQFIWLMILLGSTGATFYLIAKSIMDYSKYEVTSQIQVVNEIPADFPTITLCDNNPFASKFAENFITKIVQEYSFYDYFYESTISSLFKLKN